MTKGEQIDKLTDDICKSCKTRHKCNQDYCTMAEVVAKCLYDEGYRKVDKTKKEYNPYTNIVELISENETLKKKNAYLEDIIISIRKYFEQYGISIEDKREYRINIDDPTKMQVFRSITIPAATIMVLEDVKHN